MSMERALEVGMRKVVGANKINLLKQFYTESGIINFIGLLIALVLIELLKPVFCSITGVPVDYRFWSQTWFILFVIFTYITGTFITGMYPVFALSSLKPVLALNGKSLSAARGINLRRVLVVFQLLISIICV